MEGPIIRSLSQLQAQAPAPVVLYVDHYDNAVIYVYVENENTDIGGVYCRASDDFSGLFKGTNVPLSATIVDKRAYFSSCYRNEFNEGPCGPCGTSPSPGPGPGPGPITSTPNRVVITDAGGNVIASPNWVHDSQNLWRGPVTTFPSNSRPKLLISNSSNLVFPSSESSSWCALMNSCYMNLPEGMFGVFDQLRGIGSATALSTATNNLVGALHNVEANVLNGCAVLGGFTSTLEYCTLSNIIVRDSDVKRMMSCNSLIISTDVEDARSCNVMLLNGKIGTANRCNFIGHITQDTTSNASNSSIIGAARISGTMKDSVVIGTKSVPKYTDLNERICLNAKQVDINETALGINKIPVLAIGGVSGVSATNTGVWSQLTQHSVNFSTNHYTSVTPTVNYLDALRNANVELNAVPSSEGSSLYYQFTSGSLANDFDFGPADLNTNLRKQVGALVASVKALVTVVDQQAARIAVLEAAVNP